MSYENQNFTFFEKLDAILSINLIPIYKTNDDDLHLNVRQTHNVCKGDEYVLYPFNQPAKATKQVNIIARIDTVRGLTSDLILNTKSTQAIAQVTTGWKAKLIARPPQQKIRVRLMSSVDDKLGWRGLADGKLELGDQPSSINNSFIFLPKARKQNLAFSTWFSMKTMSTKSLTVHIKG